MNAAYIVISLKRTYGVNYLSFKGPVGYVQVSNGGLDQLPPTNKLRQGLADDDDDDDEGDDQSDSSDDDDDDDDNHGPAVEG